MHKRFRPRENAPILGATLVQKGYLTSPEQVFEFLIEELAKYTEI